jgi:hypothetical protein
MLTPFLPFSSTKKKNLEKNCEKAVTACSFGKEVNEELHVTLSNIKYRYHLLNCEYRKYRYFRGRLHGELSTPGLNSALLTWLKFFAIAWTISTPGLKRYTIRSRHRFPEVKKSLYFVFL